MSDVTITVYEPDPDTDGFLPAGNRTLPASRVSYFEDVAGSTTLSRAVLLDGSRLVTDALGRTTIVRAAAAEH